MPPLELAVRQAALALGADLPGVRLGVDIVLVADVAAAVSRFGERYLDRVFTAGEQADCSGAAAARAQRLAARFAAKEAVTKALAPADAPGWWRDIEVVRSPSGACAVTLRGAASLCAEQQGLSRWTVSMTHEGDYAAAVVAAVPDVTIY